MTQGARNIHALGDALRRLEHNAATGLCALVPCERPAIGFVSSWNNRPRGICQWHADQAQALKLSYVVHPDPFTDEEER